MTRRLTIKLNGRQQGRERFGLTESPYPRISPSDALLDELARHPIPGELPQQYIRYTLHGYSREFQDLCVSQYRPGEVVEFDVTWEE